MSYLNINIPTIECLVRGEFLRNHQDSFDKTFPCTIFGMVSIPHLTPMFHFIMEDGGIWWRMPIHAFCSKPDAPKQELDELVLWDSFSYYVSATKFDILVNKTFEFTSRRKTNYSGRYLFTLDWANEDINTLPVGYSENPGQHKCGHILELENGNFAIQPNNRLRVFDPSTTTKYGSLVIDRLLNNRHWSVETSPKWLLSDDDKYDYEIRETDE
jgi:hypothetical protein